MFKSIPILRPSDKSNEWILESDLIWDDITIPAGFITDLASIPRIAQSIIPVNGKHRSAAILHDYLYVIQDRSRGEADELFLNAMESSGVGWLQRRIMHAAVRVGGWMPWNHGAQERRKDLDAWLRFNGL